MIRGSLAMMDRALRVDSRLLRAHLVRLLFVGFIVWMLWTIQDRSMFFGAPGAQFFSMMSAVTFILITLGGLSLFATAITEEKEEMTLGLLQMAGVGPAGILLGKGVTRLVIALLILASQFPFMLLAITLGGVLVNQVWAIYVALAAYLLMMSAAGLFISVMCRTSRQASLMMSILILVYFFGPYILQEALSASVTAGIFEVDGFVDQSADWIISSVKETSIFHRLEIISNSAFNQPIISMQVVSNSTMAALLLGLSWLTFGYFNREERAASQERPFWARRWGDIRLLKVPRAWKSALVWKDFNFMTGGFPLMVFKLAFYGLTVHAVYLFFHFTGPSRYANIELWGSTAMWMGGIFLFAELSVYSSRIFREEIRWRTCPTLWMLPQSFVLTIYAKWAGCLVALLPAVILFIVGATVYPEGFFHFLKELRARPWNIFAILQFILGFHLCALLSMYIKYGSVAVTVAILFVGNMLYEATTRTLFGFGADKEVAVFSILATLFAIAGMHVAVLRRAHIVAAR